TAFEQTMLDLLDRPAHWQGLGESARAFVTKHYASKARFTEQLLDGVFSLAAPLAEVMQERGRERAARHSQQAWRECFGRAVDETLDSPPVRFHDSWKLTTHRPTTL